MLRFPVFLLLTVAAAATPPSRRVRRWATASQAADHLGITTRAIRLMVAAGRIRQYPLPGSRNVRFDLDEIDDAMIAGAR